MHKIFLIIYLLLLNTVNVFADEEQLMQLEQRVNELTNKLELSDYKLSNLEKQFEQFSKDIEYRLSNQGSTISSKNEISNSKTIEANEKSLFDHAYQELKKKNFNEAEKLLSEYLKKFPSNAYTANAYYWLAEINTSRERYDKAATNYILTFTKFPKSSKANIAHVKLVKVLNLLGKKKEACVELKKLNELKAKFDQNLQKILSREAKKIDCLKIN